jgi:hypothetical protein
MKNQIMYSQTTLKVLAILLALVFQISCSQKSKIDTSLTQKEGSNLTIPALFERTGDLAKASEWAKTKEKVKELNGKLEKDANDVKTRSLLLSCCSENIRWDFVFES